LLSTMQEKKEERKKYFCPKAYRVATS